MAGELRPAGRLFSGTAPVHWADGFMKRSRPGIVVTCLALAERRDDLSRILFEESTTIGVRWSEWRWARLAREVVTLAMSYGATPFKVSRLAGRVVTVTPEFADVLV